jgi:acyl carrier protein
MNKAVVEEEELVVDPTLFERLRKSWDEISDLKIRPKRSRHDNEMTQSRYDVMLRIGKDIGREPFKEIFEWRAGESKDEIKDRIKNAKGEVVIVKGVRNARVEDWVRLADKLGQEKGSKTAEEVMEEIRRKSRSAGAIEPEELREELEREWPGVEISWASGGQSGEYDVIVNRSAGADWRVRWCEVDWKPWSEYGNTPIRKRVEKSLVLELRKYVGQKLPEYMIPSAWVTVDSLPLAPNGKLDRRALPAPDSNARRVEGGYNAPVTAVEKALGAIWSEVLVVGRVGVTDNFFELGGHSLLAIQVISRVREAFHVELPLRALFENPTVAGLAESVEKRRGIGRRGDLLAIRPASRDEELPLSYAQQRLWFIQQLEPESVAYNLPMAVRLQGRLSIPTMRQSLGEIVRRHETLRTRFEDRDGGAVQIIERAEEIDVPILDVSELEEWEVESIAYEITGKEAGRSFDLKSGPVWRGKVVRNGVDDHRLFLSMHHVASDWWSNAVMVKEFAALYEAYREGRPSALIELEIQ